MEKRSKQMFKRLIFLVVLVVALAILARFCKNDVPEVAEDSNVVVVNNTAYEEGRMTGHYAFLKQTGQCISTPKSARYSRKDMSDDEEDEFNKGYVDGYHRAADFFQCPAGQSY